MRALIRIVVVLLVAASGYQVGLRGLAGTPPALRDQQEKFLQLCIDDFEASCSIAVRDGELYYALEWNHQRWSITSLSQAKDLLSTAKELERLKQKR